MLPLLPLLTLLGPVLEVQETAGQAVVNPTVPGFLEGREGISNYPPIYVKDVWCTAPNYRYYRVQPTKVRGYQGGGCFTESDMPDGCYCTSPEQCRSGYCVADVDGLVQGLSICKYPIVQLAEIEFWRAGSKVRTTKVPDDYHDAFRIMNGAQVSQTWGVWELEFYSDTSCTQRLVGGTPIASSAMSRGFGHSIDHTAPMGAHDTSRTYWQATHNPPLERFELHGPLQYAFDGDLTTNWWANCRNPCNAHSEWIGLDFTNPVPNGTKCVRVVQDKDHDYASFSLVVQGHRHGGDWETFASFNAATWQYGGVWETLSVPQGVSFVASTGHARALDGNLNSSVVELVGRPLDFDFGVETEIDSWRWATAAEPTENVAEEHDGVTCDRDGLCPRDMVRWLLQGSLDGTDWITIQNQETDYPVRRYRQRFCRFQTLGHLVPLSILDIWPDGRGKCAARR